MKGELTKDDLQQMPEQNTPQFLKIPTEQLQKSDAISLDIKTDASETKLTLGRNSRCVSVDTNSVCSPWSQREKSV